MTGDEALAAGRTAGSSRQLGQKLLQISQVATVSAPPA